MVKRLPTVRKTRVQSLDWEDLLEKEMATHSSIRAWKIPWTEATVHGVTKSRTWLGDFTSLYHALCQTFNLYFLFSAQSVLRCMLSHSSCIWLCATLRTEAHQAPLHGIPQASGVLDCHFLLQGIFPTQGSNLSLLHFLHWQEGCLPLVPPGRPRY